ncbi:ABC transporter [Geothrix limicola]|uniref:ABC transporter n=1 Tax=Geothrix limicola TaxID=2927978 RepID=A0ABQ5QM31_9BACT|nr:ABC transporter ATP-binding protein [Geothrix limicola]GLH75005.1 ABC transporter [Geothrix limicola]
MSAPETLLEAKNLVVRRGGVPVLQVTDLALHRGEVLALIGPNGAGKTSLMLALAALLEADGSLSFEGEALKAPAMRQAYRRRVTMVFQEPHLFDTTVHENLAAGLRWRGLPSRVRDERIQTSAARFGISHLLDRSARRLSGGEAQRTALARAFALNPEILFLDEPFSALDPPTRAGLLEDLGRILSETRTTAVFATHDQGEATRLAHRLAVMSAGRIVQEGSLAQVMNHPEDPFVAAYVGMETLAQGRVRAAVDGLLTLDVGSRAIWALGDAAPGQAVLVGIRPEHVTLSLQTDNTSSARNQLPGTVTKIIPCGPFHRIELDCGFELSAWVTPQSLSELALEPGRPVVAAFKATAVHLIRTGGADTEL